MQRRDFLSLAGASLPWLTGCKSGDDTRSGRDGLLQGPDFTLGHRLRSRDFPKPDETIRQPVVIVGAGIGGLSAGWRLQKLGVADFCILELESEPGGNSRYGSTPVTRFPFGAHYLPLPSEESHSVRALLADLGGLIGDPQAPRPEYAEPLLCHTPQERLFIGGVWQDSLMPHWRVPAGERMEMKRFQAQMNELKQARDSEGRRAFAIPISYSSPDPKWRKLDRISMLQWLRDNGYTSPHLYWYINYACRDDYGTELKDTSAWAGLHYFACRNGVAANAPGDAVLTAPEGNGWIVRALAQRLGEHLLRRQPAYRVSADADGVNVEVWQADAQRSVRYRADHLIWAAPFHLLPHVFANPPRPATELAGQSDYAPWVVANLHLKQTPRTGAGAPLAWDNVLFEGQGLGYVVATHQGVRLDPGNTVITWYHALSNEPPALARQRLLGATLAEWQQLALHDLQRAHAELPAITDRIDVFRHGHAMPRPTPGRLSDPSRQQLAEGLPRISFGHSDASGLSLFEEAHDRGVKAAERAHRLLGGG